MNRDCYCGARKAAGENGLPDGFCGVCDVCGRPGHIRPFPGASPQTGGWCARHYRIAAWISLQGRYGFILWLCYSAALVALEYHVFCRPGIWVMLGLVAFTCGAAFIAQTLLYFRLMKPTIEHR